MTKTTRLLIIVLHFLIMSCIWFSEYSKLMEIREINIIIYSIITFSTIGILWMAKDIFHKWLFNARRNINPWIVILFIIYIFLIGWCAFLIGLSPLLVLGVLLGTVFAVAFDVLVYISAFPYYLKNLSNKLSFTIISLIFTIPGTTLALIFTNLSNALLTFFGGFIYLAIMFLVLKKTKDEYLSFLIGILYWIICFSVWIIGIFIINVI